MAAYQLGSLTVVRMLQGTGEMVVDAAIAYLGLGLWIPARARVIIECLGAAASCGGDGAAPDGDAAVDATSCDGGVVVGDPEEVRVLDVSLAACDVPVLDTTGFVVDGVDGDLSTMMGGGCCCCVTRPCG